MVRKYFFIGIVVSFCGCVAGLIEMPQVFYNSHIPSVEKMVYLKSPPPCALELEAKIQDSLKLQPYDKVFYQINKNEEAVYYTLHENNIDHKKKKFIGTDYLIIFNAQCKVVEVISYKYP